MRKQANKTFELYGDTYPEDSKYAHIMAQYMMTPNYGSDPKKEWELYRDFAIKKRMSDKDMKAFMVAKDSGHHNMILGHSPRNMKDLELVYSRQFGNRTAGDECSDKNKTMEYVKCRAEKMEKEQGYPVDKAFATAWSIACKHKKLPDSKEHCQKKPSEYFQKNKTASRQTYFGALNWVQFHNDPWYDRNDPKWNKPADELDDFLSAFLSSNGDDIVRGLGLGSDLRSVGVMQEIDAEGIFNEGKNIRKVMKKIFPKLEDSDFVKALLNFVQESEGVFTDKDQDTYWQEKMDSQPNPPQQKQQPRVRVDVGSGISWSDFQKMARKYKLKIKEHRTGRDTSTEFISFPLSNGKVFTMTHTHNPLLNSYNFVRWYVNDIGYTPNRNQNYNSVRTEKEMYDIVKKHLRLKTAKGETIMKKRSAYYYTNDFEPPQEIIDILNAFLKGKKWKEFETKFDKLPKKIQKELMRALEKHFAGQQENLDKKQSFYKKDVVTYVDEYLYGRNFSLGVASTGQRWGSDKNAGVEDMFSKPHESVRTFVGEDDLLDTEDYQEMLAGHTQESFKKWYDSLSEEDRKKWDDEKVNKDNYKEKLEGKKASPSVRESEMEEGKVYKGTYGSATWHFKPTASAAKSGKVKGLIMGSDDKKPKSAFIGKKTGWDGVTWELASDVPSKMKSAGGDIMAGHTPESFKKWCKDNPDACAEWQENTEKYKDVVKDQHKKANCGCDDYQVHYIQPPQPDYFESYEPQYYEEDYGYDYENPQEYSSPLSMDMYQQLLGLPRYAKPIHQKQYEEAGKLSGVDPQIAAVMVESGNGDSDKVVVKPVTPNAVKLKPSQRTMRIKQSVGMALSMLEKGKIGGNLGAIISFDNHIMDGHHRWAAAILAGDSRAKVGGYKADEKGEVLVRVLNILTKGYFGVRNGKKGTGNIADFNKAKTEETLRDFATNGISGDYPKTAQQVKDILTSAFGDVEKGIKRMSENADLIETSVPTWAPKRKDMPVINPTQVPEAASVLSDGKVDWSPAYARAASQKVADNVDQILEDNQALIDSLDAQTKIIEDLF